MRANRLLFASVQLAAAFAFAACSGSASREEPRRPYTWAIDPSIDDDLPLAHSTARGERPVAASADEGGVVSAFIANEVVVEPRTPAELTAFLARYGGTVIDDDSIPDPPAGHPRTLTPMDLGPTQYVVRIDPDTVSTATLARDAEAAGFGGGRTFSTPEAAKVMAVAMRELSEGRRAEPNYLLFPAGAMLTSTEEHPDGSGGYWDAFGMLDLRFSPLGSKASVWRAWQLLTAHGIEQRVEVAIIDGGFWLDASGAPLSALAGGGSDIEMYGAYSYYQYDFDGDDYTAGGANPAKCTGGNACPWHGNGSASVAAGRANNRYGVAGTGGLVADPVLFKVDLTRTQVRTAIRTAIHWGLDVVNMSFGGACNADCTLFPGTAGFWMWIAQVEHGIVLVAAAGNDGENAVNYYPCAVPGVICVGALSNGTTAPMQGPDWYTNYGSRVDLYAPTNILAMPNGDTTPNFAGAGGTSASSPFVAGVAAMMRALDPALTPAQIRTILRDTAWPAETDSQAPRSLNAYAAVKHVIDGQLPPDPFEENDGAGQAKTLSTGSAHENLTIVAADPDHYRFTVPGYTFAEIRLQYMTGLGDMSVYLVAEAAPGAAVVEKIVKSPNEKLYQEKYLPPGSYRLGVTAKDPNLYHLTATATPHALSPDVFEPNDTLSTAASPPAGSYAVNLHHAGDVDFYAFTVPDLTVVQQYQFRVPSWDVGPLSMQLFAGDGTPLTAAGPWGSVTIATPGSYVVKVSGSGEQTAYTFMHGVTLSSAMAPQLAIPIDFFWKVDPNPDPWNPVDRLLVGTAEALVVEPNDDILAMFSALDLLGADVKAALYGPDGALLSEGEAFDTRLGPGLSFSFAGLDPGASYFLVVTRAEEPPAEQGALLPAVPYSLQWEETVY